MAARNTAVYVQIAPKSHVLATDYLVKMILPYDRTTTPADVRATWPEVERGLRRGLTVAKHEGATPLPNQLEDCLLIKQEVPAALVDNPYVDLYSVLETDLHIAIDSALGSSRETPPDD